MTKFLMVTIFAMLSFGVFADVYEAYPPTSPIAICQINGKTLIVNRNRPQTKIRFQAHGTSLDIQAGLTLDPHGQKAYATLSVVQRPNRIIRSQTALIYPSRPMQSMWVSVTPLRQRYDMRCEYKRR